MGLFDSVLGALGQGQAGGGHAGLLNAVIGMLGPGGGAAASGGIGGLVGLVERFHQGGLGDVVNSWVGTGQNLPVSGDQLRSVLGGDTVANLASQLGMNHGDLLGQLSHLLPQVVDQLTPNGQLPQAGGGLGDLAGMLGGLLNPR
jgi:uncharacterized protein YidB (DUF937 family)